MFIERGTIHSKLRCALRQTALVLLCVSLYTECLFVYINLYTYKYIYMYRERGIMLIKLRCALQQRALLPLCVSLYIEYIFVYTNIYTYIYIYVCVYRERHPVH